MKAIAKFKIGQNVEFTNGSPALYEAEVTDTRYNDRHESWQYLLKNDSGQEWHYEEQIKSILLSKQIKRTYRGVTYFASSEEAIDKMITDREYESSIFSRGSVYTYSYHARLLQDGTVELVQNFENGKTKKVTKFDNKDAYYKSGE